MALETADCITIIVIQIWWQAVLSVQQEDIIVVVVTEELCVANGHDFKTGRNSRVY